jgi:hypothetical protein
MEQCLWGFKTVTIRVISESGILFALDEGDSNGRFK